MSRKEVAYLEYDKFISLLSNSNTITNNNDTKEIFMKIYYLNYISTRFETKKIIQSNYYDAMLTFLLEGSLVFTKNFQNASLFLLRAVIENFLKSILHINELEINNRVYTTNHSTMIQHLSENSFQNKKIEECIKILRTNYSSLSGLSHSAVKKDDFNISKFYQDSINNFEITQNSINIWHSTLDSISKCFTFYCYETYQNWEYFELQEVLQIAFSKTYARKLTEYFIDNKEF